MWFEVGAAMGRRPGGAGGKKEQAHTDLTGRGFGVFCSHCGSATSQQDGFCRTCGTPQGVPSPAPAPAPSGRAPDVRIAPPGTPAAVAAPDFSIALGIIGILAGGFVGFLMRPAVFLIGQLPFGVVATRGAYLTGLDQLLRSTAETSFNHMVAAAVVGGLAGVVAGWLIKSVSARRA
jgi:hypothetical protein